jgi:hypothetical protein
MDHAQEQWAEEHLGIKKPRRFIVDASVLSDLDEHKTLQENIKQYRIEYEFPDGLNQLSLFEECRALTLVDDFEAMYDVTMQLLTGKSIVIRMKQPSGVKTELGAFQVTDRCQNLRAIPIIDEYPCLIIWLTEFIGAVLLKKYPPLSADVPPAAAVAETKGGRKRRGLFRRKPTAS